MNNELSNNNGFHSWGFNLNKLDLSIKNQRDSIGNDITNTLITGNIDNWNFPANTYNSRFYKSRITDVIFDNKDFKDCVFIECDFYSCSFNLASIVSCSFYNCYFSNVTFDQEALHDCNFVDCEFIKSNILNSMVRNSKVKDCIFDLCVFTNKVFDSCLLLNTNFLNSIIDIKVITDNFGITSCTLLPSCIRANRSFPDSIIIDFDSLDMTQYSTIEKLNIEHYIANSFDIDDTLVDKIFEIKTWLEFSQSPSNFSRNYNNFADYLIYLHKMNKLENYILYKFYCSSYNMLESIKNESQYISIAEVLTSIVFKLQNCLAGTFKEITDLCENFYNMDADKLTFQTDDNVSDFEINEFVNNCKMLNINLNLLSIRRNSPANIDFLKETIEVLTFLFVMTKTDVNVYKIDKSNNLETIWQLNLGTAGDLAKVFGFKFLAPGQVFFDISINIKYGLIKKARKILFMLIK